MAFLRRALKVSRSGYYAYHAARPAAERDRQEEELVGEIRKIHAKSRCAYGAPRITAALRRRGCRINRSGWRRPGCSPRGPGPRRSPAGCGCFEDEAGFTRRPPRGRANS
ncbi:IS3 family transposase [Streptomyces sp. NPDC127051]|uniref:IS3 family transposase n=1 Tax=Streptomyces sp. NPDC127051 TaxID=3347119 RepID=UPI00364FE928